MTRLLSIVFEVDARPGVSAAELAVDLGVSVRTLYRDVSALQLAGVPIYGTPGRNGGLRLVEGYRSRTAALRADEAAALLAGLVPGLARQLGMGDDADRAARKVRAQSAAPGSGLGVGQILVDPIGWYRSTVDVPYLPTIADAMRAQRVVVMRYRRWAEPNEVRRRIEPLGLVLKAGTWYLMARSRQQVRTYRVDQIASAQLTDDEFTVDPPFDLVAGWTAFVASFRERLHMVDATVRVNRAVRHWLRSEGDPAMREAIDLAVGDGPDHDGEREVVLPFESTNRAVAELLRFGTGAEVLGPPALRDHLAATAQQIASRYRDARPVSVVVPHARVARPPAR